MTAVTVAGIDGPVLTQKFDRDGCCPPSICTITLCQVICNFVHQLPSGRLWDRAKWTALKVFDRGGCAPPACPDEVCNAVVRHAVHTGNLFWTVLHEAVAPAIYEADPFTAFDTVDDWLVRLGWRDCFHTACRSKTLGDLTPIEVMGDCCPVYAPPNYDPELVLAVKLGIVRSLARLDMGIIPSLDVINFVIEPLGAKVEAVGLSCAPLPCSTEDCDTPDANCADAGPEPTIDEDGDPCCPPCHHPVLRICNDGDTLPRPIKPRCDIDNRDRMHQTIPAYHDTGPGDPEGLPERIWPGVLAAECIVRAVLPPLTPIELTRC